MNEITEDIGRMTVKGEVAALEMRDTKNGQSKIVTFSMTDHKGSVNCKLFLGGRRQSEDGSVEEQAEKLRAALKDGLWVKARGNYRYDDYKREMVLMVSDVMSVPKPVREDNAPRKRVELHLHTQMSTMDACASAKALISQAAAWGHPRHRHHRPRRGAGLPGGLRRGARQGHQVHSRLRGLSHRGRPGDRRRRRRPRPRRRRFRRPRF